MLCPKKEYKDCYISQYGQFNFLGFYFYLQAEVFDKFLHGSTLEECYAAVASVANRWLDLLDVSGLKTLR